MRNATDILAVVKDMIPKGFSIQVTFDAYTLSAGLRKYKCRPPPCVALKVPQIVEDMNKIYHVIC